MSNEDDDLFGFDDEEDNIPIGNDEIIPEDSFKLVNDYNSIYSSEDTINQIQISNKERKNRQHFFNMLVYGSDNTGKTGFILDWLVSNKIKTLIIDIDETAEELLQAIYPEIDFIDVYNPIEVIGNKEIDYDKTIERIKSLADVLRIKKEYDAFIFDGLTTFLEYCLMKMKVEKSIKKEENKIPIGLYALRNENFLSAFDKFVKLENIHKFYVGHENLNLKEGTTITTLKDGTTMELNNSGKSVRKANRVVNQKIEMVHNVDGMGNDEYMAKIHKWRTNIKMVGREYSIAKITNNGSSWNSDAIKRIFNSKLPIEEDKTFNQID